MPLFRKEIDDVRGTILFSEHKNGFVNLIEINKGFARGGHYHANDQNHFIFCGKVEISLKNINTGHETKRIISEPELIKIPAYTAHLFVADEYTVIAEFNDKPYEAINFDEYRKIVNEQTK